MKKLKYLYVELPKQVRLISKAMGLNYSFKPYDTFAYFDPNEQANICYTNGISIDDLFGLAETGLFDHIFVLLTGYNQAYYYDDNDNEVQLLGWIDLLQFENG